MFAHTEYNTKGKLGVYAQHEIKKKNLNETIENASRENWFLICWAAAISVSLYMASGFLGELVEYHTLTEIIA